MRLPPTSAHLPKPSGGFDASKPYEPALPPPEATEHAADKPKADELPRRPLRPVAALLGGFGKK